ncbi:MULTISPECIES: hypothetical protein [Paenibacillus]|uniref:hypothetical protein n=1 Tax=Paenibacillus TaxID=44249 RepID=UPI00096F0FD7|nr:hypothetical protein [Paenibacillus amylolyticus]OMF39019.1 hypothetical protein BK136_28045 [Paenibacillus amylolyticus]
MKLDSHHIERLVPWFGYGNFNEAEVVFFGNEEGLGGYPIEAVLGRCQLYGYDPNTWIDNDWRLGYWDETSHDGYLTLGRITNEIRTASGLSPVAPPPPPASPFLEFQARMLLHFEQKDQNWFNVKKNLLNNQWNQIQELKEHLYSNKTKIKAGLVDWRPLPRPTEDVWPYDGIDEKKYISAFKLANANLKKITELNNGKLAKEELDEYSKMLWNRAELIRKVFVTFPFSTLIGVGDMNAKKKLLEFIFRNENLTFTKKTLRNGKSYEIAELILPNKKLTIILTLFFNHRSNCLQLEGLQHLCEDVLEPIIGC